MRNNNIFEYFENKKYKIKKDDEKFIARIIQKNFFEEINITKTPDDKFFVVISIKDTRPNLSFFKNFNIKINQKNKFSLLFCYSFQNLDQLDIYLQNYFQYRNILLDIKKISNNRCKSEYLYSLNSQNRESKYKIANFSQINKENGIKYLSELKKLIRSLYNDVRFSLSGPIPINFSIYRINKNIRTIINLFNICFFDIDSFLHLKFTENSKISFFLSYLYYYSLFDELYINLQREILKDLLFKKSI